MTAIPVYLRAPIPLPITTDSPLKVVVTNQITMPDPLPVTVKTPLEVVVTNQAAPGASLPPVFEKGQRVMRQSFMDLAFTQPTPPLSLFVGDIHGEWAKLDLDGNNNAPWYHVPSMNCLWFKP